MFGPDIVFLNGCGYYCNTSVIRQNLSAAVPYPGRFPSECHPVKLVENSHMESLTYFIRLGPSCPGSCIFYLMILKKVLVGMFIRSSTELTALINQDPQGSTPRSSKRDRTRVYCKKTSAGALPYSRDTGYGQSGT